MSILLSSEEKTFVKNNKEILASIFGKRIEDLKEQILSCEDSDRDSMIKMINEFKDWLLLVKILSKRRTKKIDNFI